MPLKAMIVDDEPFVREDLKAMLAAHPEIQVVCEAGTVAEAEKLLQDHDLGVVFLDIQLRGGTGFDLVPSIDPSVNIIFITAHDDYAIRAFEVNALDYLLKPVHADRLAVSIGRLKGGRQAGHVGGSQQAEAFKPGDRVLVKTDRGRIFVNLNNIVVITSMGGNYTVLVVEGGDEIIARKPMKAWEALLPESLFLRIHRSTIINTNAIEQVLNHKSGSCRVCLGGQHPVFSVSRRMAPRLKSLVAEQGKL